MEKVKIGNFPVGTPTSFVGIDISGKEILAKIDDVLRMDYKAISSGTNKLRYTQYKPGSTTGIGSRILLIAPIPNLTDTIDAIGVLGSLFLLRGGVVDGQPYAPFYVKTDLSFFRVTGRLVGDLKIASAALYGASTNFNLGTCYYSGQLYMAIKFNTEYSFRTCFQGFYTDDCVFTHVITTDISDWTEL
jgi:hypothetical protein|nr:MAG TPA: hypothetical protein [Caudoviricetes sp.]